MNIEIDRRVMLALKTLKKKEQKEVYNYINQIQSDLTKKTSVVKNNLAKSPFVKILSEGGEGKVFSYGKENHIQLVVSIKKNKEDELSIVDIAYPDQLVKE